ncbi:MAG: ATP-dependent metallopeptidase FtsH/Yme1/Tma family protein, partial [Acidobacteria bacterium]|nr:ATP-dependent metallopeptidase FtsH/Yme1/Tma family protein [Acidobacteriota bacterium]
MNTLTKNILFWLVIVVLALVAYRFLAGTTTTQTELSFSEFLSQAEAGKISEVTINGSDVEGA